MAYSYAGKDDRKYPYYVCLNAQRKGWAVCPGKSLPARGIEDSFGIAVVVLAFMGLAVLSFAGSSNVLLQTLSPDEMRGRAISVFAMIILGLVPAGSLLLGSLASVVGLQASLSVGGAVALVIAIVIWATDPQLRAA